MQLFIYAWSPLAIVEVAGSGHNDVLPISCLLAADGAIIHKKDTLSICFIAASVALKLVAAALLPLSRTRLSSFSRGRSWRSGPHQSRVI